MSGMNNFYMNPDPLLAPSPMQQINPMVFQQLQQMSIKDNIGELDSILKNLNPAVISKLSMDLKFSKLNSEFQNRVQQELLMLVKNKLNTDQSIIDNIKEQMQLIDCIKKEVESEKEASIIEMNDYMKNYSNLTFDDYRKMKNGEHIDKKK